MYEAPPSRAGTSAIIGQFAKKKRDLLRSSGNEPTEFQTQNPLDGRQSADHARDELSLY